MATRASQAPERRPSGCRWREPLGSVSPARAETRKQHGSEGSHVVHDPNEDDRVCVVFDWDEEGFQNFLSDPDVPAIVREAGHQGRPRSRSSAPARCRAPDPNQRGRYSYSVALSLTTLERSGCDGRINTFSPTIHQGGSNHGSDRSALVHGLSPMQTWPRW